jgi:hypothetical protein
LIVGSIIKKIKQANNYQGSKMQKAIEAYEALNNGESQEQAVVKQPTQPKPKVTPTNVPDEDLDQVPF